MQIIKQFNKDTKKEQSVGPPLLFTSLRASEGQGSSQSPKMKIVINILSFTHLSIYSFQT